MKKKQKADIDGMVMKAHYLHAMEKESMACKPLSDMDRQDFLKTIEGLNKTIETLHGVISDLRKSEAEHVNMIAKLTDRIAGLTEEIRILREEVEKYKNRNGRDNQEKYGTKSKKSSGKSGTGKSRVQEKDDWDGIGKRGVSQPVETDTGNEGEASPDASSVEEESVKRGPRGSYDRMGAACTEVIESDTVGLPATWREISRRMENEYTRISYIKCTSFEIITMMDEYGNLHEVFNPKDKNEKRSPKANVISHTHCTPEFLASLALSRYGQSTPICRDMYRINQEKMSVCAQTISNWLHRGARLLGCVIDSLEKQLLEGGSVLNIDETWADVRIFDKKHRNGKYFKKYVWVIVNKKNGAAYFLYDNDMNDSRGRRPIAKFLSGFTGGIQTDAYVVYKFFSEEDSKNRHALCWAHVRTKFFDAAKIAKDKLAAWFVREINYLYEVELENRINNRTDEEIKARRMKDDVTDCLQRIFKRAASLQKAPKLHLSDIIRRAVNYLMKGKEKLLTYIMDGRFDIDNLEAERKVRPFALDRKNIVQFGSEKGIRDACAYHTILETCKQRGVSYYDYLVAVFHALKHLDLSKLKEQNIDFSSYIPGVLSLESN